MRKRTNKHNRQKNEKKIEEGINKYNDEQKLKTREVIALLRKEGIKI